jgi:hypothetical protein
MVFSMKLKERAATISAAPAKNNVGLISNDICQAEQAQPASTQFLSATSGAK